MIESYSQTVAKNLERRGWKCFDLAADNANGPDLTIARNGKTYRVEIKKACKSTRCWKTTPVGKSGRNCDLIVILLPNHKLLIQPMKDHLALSSKSGHRFITELVEANL